VAETVALLRSLGFTIHESKCVTTPTQVAKFLGFLLNSKDMIISMIPEKVAIIKSKCHNLAQLEGPTPIRDVASVAGLMVSAFEGVQYAPLFYRSLENDKTYELKKNNGWNSEGTMTLSPLAKQDLSWWITNVGQLSKAIMPKPSDLTLTTDSSLKGWGGVIEGTSCVASGRWSHQESQLHINLLELKAIFLPLQALCNRMQNRHIKSFVTILLLFLTFVIWVVQNLAVAMTSPGEFYVVHRSGAYIINFPLTRETEHRSR